MRVTPLGPARSSRPFSYNNKAASFPIVHTECSEPHGLYPRGFEVTVDCRYTVLTIANLGSIKIRKQHMPPFASSIVLEDTSADPELEVVSSCPITCWLSGDVKNMPPINKHNLFLATSLPRSSHALDLRTIQPTAAKRAEAYFLQAFYGSQ
jgi:hypothetical protein